MRPSAGEDSAIVTAACLLRGALSGKWDLSKEDFSVPGLTKLVSKPNRLPYSYFMLRHEGHDFKVTVEHA